MKLDEYLEIVSEQIRYQKIRPTITEELKNHILDQAQDYEACGAFPKEALERAIREMGDPVETGVSLDRIHRPQMNWGLVAAIALFSLLSVGAVYWANLVSPDSYFWQQQAFFTAAGFMAMLLMYRIDYSILGKFRWMSAVLFLFLMIFLHLTRGFSIYGSARWIDLGFVRISISETMLLYVPLFGAALYAFRGDGYIIFLKLIPLIVIPVWFIFHLPDLPGAIILFTCLILLLAFAVLKGWYRINKKKVLTGFASLALLAPAALIGYIYFFGADYQIARLSAFFTQGGSENYMMTLAGNLRSYSALLGSSEKFMEVFSGAPIGDYLTDYILVFMCGIYGTLAVMAIIAGLAFMIMKIFQISVSQKNQLGMIAGFGCGLVFLTKTALGVLNNFQLIPYTSIRIPFLSYGGSNVLVSYILLGLILSIYRYKNILPSQMPRSLRQGI